MKIAADLFEEHGHPTQFTKKPGEVLDSGFFHSLGHGVGLEVHEHPYLSPRRRRSRAGRRDRARAGALPPRARRRPARGHRDRHRGRRRCGDRLPIRAGSVTQHAIETMFLEERRYPPPPAFAAQANAQPSIYDEPFEAFWEREGKERLTWFEPFTELLRVGAAVRQVVSRRHAQRLLQLRRPARRRRPRRQGRLSLGGRARGRASRDHVRASSSAMSCASRTRSRSSVSARARRSRSTWGWSPSFRSRCSPARASVRRTRSSSAASPPTRSPAGWSTWAARC